MVKSSQSFSHNESLQQKEIPISGRIIVSQSNHNEMTISPKINGITRPTVCSNLYFDPQKHIPFQKKCIPLCSTRKFMEIFDTGSQDIDWLNTKISLHYTGKFSYLHLSTDYSTCQTFSRQLLVSCDKTEPISKAHRILPTGLRGVKKRLASDWSSITCGRLGAKSSAIWPSGLLKVRPAPQHFHPSYNILISISQWTHLSAVLSHVITRDKP